MSDHDQGEDNNGLAPGFPPGGGWSGSVPSGAGWRDPVPPGGGWFDPVPPGGGWPGPPGTPAWPGQAPDPGAAHLADAPSVPRAPAPTVPPGAPERGRRSRQLTRKVALTLLVAVGLAGVGGGGAGLALELTRTATKAEVSAALQAEIASRWQRLAAGKIFPQAIGYTTSDEGAPTTARLVGIAPSASCAASLDPPVAGLLRRYGCVTVLRATYVDSSGTLAATAGIVVMTSANAAGQAANASGGGEEGSGIRTFSLPATVADQFGDPQRRAFSPVHSTGPYVFLYAAGYTDGRVSGSATADPPLIDLASGVISRLQTELTSHGRACQMKDIRC
jgi:hypothetical protein